MSKPIDVPWREISGHIFGILAKTNPSSERLIYLLDLCVWSDFNAVLSISSPKATVGFQTPIKAAERFQKSWVRGLPGAVDKTMFIETTQDSHINYCAVEV